MGASAHLQVFILLQVADVASTAVGLRWGAEEANPGALGILGWGWPALIGAKLLLVAGIVALLLLHGGPAWTTMVHGLNILYGAVVGWNVALLAGMDPWQWAVAGAAIIALLPPAAVLATRRGNAGAALRRSRRG